MSVLDKIYDSFEELLLNNNIIDISITKICKYNNVNRNTFYYHFNDLNEFIKSYYLYRFGNSIKEKIKNKQLVDACYELIDYALKTKKSLISLFVYFGDIISFCWGLFFNKSSLNFTKVHKFHKSSLNFTKVHKIHKSSLNFTKI